MAPVTCSGILDRGAFQIGGESTGWVLQADDSGDIEVDVSQVESTAERLAGMRVVITGHFEIEHYIERGPIEILVAESIRAFE